jgi:hypothetical protein
VEGIGGGSSRSGRTLKETLRRRNGLPSRFDFGVDTFDPSSMSLFNLIQGMYVVNVYMYMFLLSHVSYRRTESKKMNEAYNIPIGR